MIMSPFCFHLALVVALCTLAIAWCPAAPFALHPPCLFSFLRIFYLVVSLSCIIYEQQGVWSASSIQCEESRFSQYTTTSVPIIVAFENT